MTQKFCAAFESGEMFANDLEKNELIALLHSNIWLGV